MFKARLNGSSGKCPCLELDYPQGTFQNKPLCDSQEIFASLSQVTTQCNHL